MRVWDRTDKRIEARRTVEGLSLETAGDSDGERRSGRRSSGVSGSSARRHVKASARAHSVPGSTRNTMPCSGKHNGEHGHDGDAIHGDGLTAMATR